jgi:hypothetical protein
MRRTQASRELDPTWLGDSTGHWEGETLVVDTVGTNGQGRPLNGYVAGAVYLKTDTAPRLPVSDQLHMVERMRVVGGGEYLEDEITVTDLKTYTRSFTVKHYWQRRDDLDLLEYVCADNRRPGDEGHTGAVDECVAQRRFVVCIARGREARRGPITPLRCSISIKRSRSRGGQGRAVGQPTRLARG